MITGQLFDNEAIPYLSFTFNNKIIHAESSNKIIFHRKITVRSCFVSINVSLISGLKRYNVHKMPACFDDRGQHIYWCYLFSYKSVHLTGEYGTIKMAKISPKKNTGLHVQIHTCPITLRALSCTRLHLRSTPTPVSLLVYTQRKADFPPEPNSRLCLRKAVVCCGANYIDDDMMLFYPSKNCATAIAPLPETHRCIY